MKKMVALISALVVLTVAFSGCVGDNNSAVNGTEPNNSGENVNPAESTANVSELNEPAVNVTEPSNSPETNVDHADNAADTNELNKPISGGTDSSSSEANANSAESADISKLENLPAGFEYIGSVPLDASDIKIDYNAENVSEVVGGSEGMYKYNDSDFYLDVIELGNAEAATNLIDAYKSSFKPLANGSRFVEESFNGHSAVRIADYVTIAGNEAPRYTYIWSNENHVFVVTGSTADSSLVKQLAEATGY
ncbi:hypothetical protein [Methanosarcina sp. UBA411]|jgi:hypothetical protein|uniref:hypothetical protein n=1 Tax=Methanosarcina sp. UBA411 TaxID=1915589 RepID=UPI0025E8D8C1|nr:hypothetical protein [Methanosarcina sp. UBA411]